MKSSATATRILSFGDSDVFWRAAVLEYWSAGKSEYSDLFSIIITPLLQDSITPADYKPIRTRFALLA
jgi:hypothetical protein